MIPRPFLDMPDPRAANRSHKLIDVLILALFAVVCGADGWVAVTTYGRAKLAWLKTFLDLPNGIPSHDTFGKVFAHLNPDAFERCFRQWMASVVQLSGGKLVAIDGKSLRQSFEHAWDKSGMAHMVSAFVQTNHMVFGQIKTDGKGQELSARSSPNSSANAAIGPTRRKQYCGPFCFVSQSMAQTDPIASSDLLRNIGQRALS